MHQTWTHKIAGPIPRPSLLGTTLNMEDPQQKADTGYEGVLGTLPTSFLDDDDDDAPFILFFPFLSCSFLHHGHYIN